ncbi:MAG: UDP-N-acetylmuramate dehydrogenase [Bacteroidetes bacterium]|jgi:UDP-N-acetylmuramate dehydrogenase|nr:UDP-N-acetylmuramate dehydrogenase [Bacteroidota bacterium]
MHLHLKNNISLKDYNTFGIDVKAMHLAEAESEESLRNLLLQIKSTQTPLMILGGGSNVLLMDDYSGWVILNKLKGIRIVSETDDTVLVKAGSGEVWHHLVLWSVERNLGGIENLSLIPGSVGAAPIQNIGAYGVELKNSFHSLEAMEIASGNIHTFTNEACKFGYRNSVFKNEHKGKYVITSVVLELKKNPLFNTTYGAIQSELQKQGNNKLSVKAISDAVIAIRRSKLPDPAQIGNAGSFFKNPEISKEAFETVFKNHPEMVHYPGADGKIKIAAGWMIEQCGWKGYRKGDAGCHVNQALVLVNYGNATGRDIYNLAMEIKSSVKNKFGVEIEPEVNLIGTAT